MRGHTRHHGLRRPDDAPPGSHDRDAGRDAAAPFAELGPALVSLIEGAAGCSPYLRDLMQRERVWLHEALLRPPEETFAALLEQARTEGAGRLGDALRQAKRRVALLTALADLGGVWPLESVTGALTEFADAAVAACLSVLVADELRKDRLPGATEADLRRRPAWSCSPWARWGQGSSTIPPTST